MRPEPLTDPWTYTDALPDGYPYIAIAGDSHGRTDKSFLGWDGITADTIRLTELFIAYGGNVAKLNYTTDITY